MKNEVIKSKKEELGEKLRKHSGKRGENYDKLSLRMKRNDAKEGHDELTEKLKMKQRRVLPILRESLRAETVDAEYIEEEINNKYESDTQRKESEEQLECEKIEK